jgi:hypothetical protein
MPARTLRSQGKHVHMRLRLLSALMLLALVAQPIGAIPALAQGAPASAAAGTLSGTITDASGTPLAGATVILSGPHTARATTDNLGHYSISAPPGIYRFLVRAGGFADSAQDGITVAATATTLDASLSRPTLSSLQTIGSVSTSVNNAGPQFNTSAAAQETIGQSTFENQGDISVRNILDETPGIVDSVSNGSANAGVRGAITYPTIRGGLSYETASLIDGHPVSVGKYGDYVTTFLNRYLFQTIEVQKGPGSLPPEINRSVNGTVNFRTWDPTTAPTGNAEFGVDGFGGKFSNLRFSDTVLNKNRRHARRGRRQQSELVRGESERRVVHGFARRSGGRIDGDEDHVARCAQQLHRSLDEHGRMLYIDAEQLPQPQRTGEGTVQLFRRHDVHRHDDIEPNVCVAKRQRSEPLHHELPADDPERDGSERQSADVLSV